MQPIQVKIQDIKNPIYFPKNRKLIVINKHNGSIGNIDSMIINQQEKRIFLIRKKVQQALRLLHLLPISY